MLGVEAGSAGGGGGGEEELDAQLDYYAKIYKEEIERMKRAQRVVDEKRAVDAKKEAEKRARRPEDNSNDMAEGETGTLLSSPSEESRPQQAQPAADDNEFGGWFRPSFFEESDDEALVDEIYSSQDENGQTNSKSFKKKPCEPKRRYVYGHEFDFAKTPEPYWMSLPEAHKTLTDLTRLINRKMTTLHRRLATVYNDKVKPPPGWSGAGKIKAVHVSIAQNLTEVGKLLKGHYQYNLARLEKILELAVDEEDVTKGTQQCGGDVSCQWTWSRSIKSNDTLNVIEILRNFEFRTTTFAKHLNGAEKLLSRWEAKDATQQRRMVGLDENGLKKKRKVVAKERSKFATKFEAQVRQAVEVGGSRPRTEDYKSLNTLKAFMFKGWEEYDPETQGPGKDDLLPVYKGKKRYREQEQEDSDKRRRVDGEKAVLGSSAQDAIVIQDD